MNGILNFFEVTVFLKGYTLDSVFFILIENI